MSRIQDLRLQSNNRSKSSKKSITDMIPTNINPTYNCLLFQVPCPTIFAPYQLNFIPQPLPPSKFQVKIEEEESKRSTEVEAVPPKSPGRLGSEQAKRKKGDEGTATSTKKQFKKDKRCPVHECRKKYSSRIALRAHIRKQHAGWYEETSDYEP